MGRNHSDYKEISFTNSQTSYTIGTEYGTPFRAESLLFLTDQDCYVRFNSATAVQHLIPTGDYIGLDKKSVIIYVTRKTVDGTLKVWAEGDIAL